MAAGSRRATQPTVCMNGEADPEQEESRQLHLILFIGHIAIKMSLDSWTSVLAKSKVG